VERTPDLTGDQKPEGEEQIDGRELYQKSRGEKN
jgi:hypothetical protein